VLPTLRPVSSDELRTGLDEQLLGAPVLLPTPTDSALPVVRLEYVHFSVLMRTDRWLAAVTGVGIDGGRLMDLDRSGIEWRLDDRLPAAAQTGPAMYADNDLDRGHLVRRADAVWGTTREEAQAGNADTFHYANAAPQAARFNQGEQLWLGLETYLLEHAATYDQRLVVFTGPVLAPDDPLYRGVQIPLRFFKVAVFRVDGAAGRPGGEGTALNAGARGPAGLGATGYLLDQTPQVDDLGAVLARARAAGEVPPLGPFRTFQVPIADLAALTGLDLTSASAVDVLPAAGATAQDHSGGWRQLSGYGDIVLGRRGGKPLE
jgi:endonuclease G, mitochondrial